VDGALGDLIARCSERPLLIVAPESSFPLLPWGLVAAPIPTMCFQIDTYSYTAARIRQALLFDYVLTFHPGFEAQFRRAGHPRPLTTSHLVEADLFRPDGHESRVYDVGWVGSLEGHFYTNRRRLLPSLAAAFTMNDWSRPYSYPEMAALYCSSRIVVNVGRDDYPQDANLRCFEAMAAGALLITELPSELEAFGLRPGEHFVGYHDEAELLSLVRSYVNDDKARQRISEAGRERVLAEHTYDAAVERLLDIVHSDDGRLFAPAREWPEERVRLIYLHYYATHLCFGSAWRQLRALVPASRRATAVGLYLIGRALAGRARMRLVHLGR
jgi:hypothetical protein